MDIIIPYKPSPKQCEAHAAPERYVLFGGAMGGGKTAFLVNESMVLLLDYPGNHGFLGRWENSAFKRTTYITLLEYLPQALIKVHNKTEQFFELINGSVLFYGGLKSSGSTSNKTIIDKIKSMNLGFFAIDEASEIPKDLFLVFCSRIGRGLLEKIIKEKKLKKYPFYKGLLTSNPEPGWLRDEFIDKNLPDHRYIRALPSDNPHLPANYVENLKKTFPLHWVQRYLEGDWDAKTGDNYLFNYNTIIDAIGREAANDENDEIEFGVDVAEFGGDSTIIYAKEGQRATLLYEGEKTGLMETCGLIQQFVDDYGSPDAPIKIDGVGIGAGVCSRLEELHRNVIRIIGGEAADERDDGMLFFNKRSQLFWELKEFFEKGEISIEDDGDLKSQLSSIRFERHSDKKIKVESKTEMKKRGLSSPDKADALAYAFAGYDSQPSIYFI